MKRFLRTPIAAAAIALAALLPLHGTVNTAGAVNSASAQQGDENSTFSSQEIVNKGHGKAAINDQVATQSGARKIINECFSADAKLDPATCPREAPAGSAEPAPAGPAAAGNPPQTTP